MEAKVSDTGTTSSQDGRTVSIAQEQGVEVPFMRFHRTEGDHVMRDVVTTMPTRDRKVSRELRSRLLSLSPGARFMPR